MLNDKYQWLIEANVRLTKNFEHAVAEKEKRDEEFATLQTTLTNERLDWEAERTNFSQALEQKCKYYDTLLGQEREGRKNDRTRMITEISELELNIERERKDNLNKQLELRTEHRERLEQQMKKEQRGLTVLKNESQRFKQQTYERDKKAQVTKAKYDQAEAQERLRKAKFQSQLLKRQKQEHALQMQLEARLRRMEAIQSESIQKVVHVNTNIISLHDLSPSHFHCCLPDS